MVRKNPITSSIIGIWVFVENRIFGKLQKNKKIILKTNAEYKNNADVHYVEDPWSKLRIMQYKSDINSHI